MSAVLPPPTDVLPGDRRPRTLKERALLPASPAEIELEDRLSLPELLAGLPDLERRAVMLATRSSNPS